jgi:hypothetical protein
MARRYSVSGRFSQPDPYSGSYDFSDPQSLNRYAYVGNDPINFKDPIGLRKIIVWGRFCSQVEGGEWQCSNEIEQEIDEPDPQDPRGFGGNPLIPREPTKPIQTPKTPPQVQPKKVVPPKPQSRRDCIVAAIKKYANNQAAAAVQTYLSWENLGILVTFGVVSWGTSEAVETAEIVEMAHTGEAIARVSGMGGAIAASLGVIKGIEQHITNKRAFDAAVQACPR